MSAPSQPDAFLDPLVDALASLPGVVAVALGGSRAQGTAGADSDWDLGVHYRGDFDPAGIRALGFDGEVSDLGAWGGGVFNGGAWLQVDGRSVDLHYRDVAALEREIERAARGEFHVEPLMFHLAGIPSTILLAEVATGIVLRGSLPQVGGYPAPLRASAADHWRGMAEATLDYAERGHAAKGRATQALGLAAVGAVQYAHAAAAATGTWVTNDKQLLALADFGDLDAIFAGAINDPTALVDAVRAVRDLGRERLGD